MTMYYTRFFRLGVLGLIVLPISVYFAFQVPNPLKIIFIALGSASFALVCFFFLPRITIQQGEITYWFKRVSLPQVSSIRVEEFFDRYKKNFRLIITSPSQTLRINQYALFDKEALLREISMLSGKKVQHVKSVSPGINYMSWKNRGILYLITGVVFFGASILSPGTAFPPQVTAITSLIIIGIATYFLRRRDRKELRERVKKQQ